MPAILSKSFSIRPITNADMPAVLEVYRQCEDFLALGPVAVASMGMVEQDVAHSTEVGGLFCGVFAADGRMVGVVDFVPCGWEGDPTAAFLSLLMIAAPERRGGLGQRIVEWVEHSICEDLQIRVIFSGVQVNNPGAIRFWQAQGYRIISEPQLMADGTTCVQLQKDLLHGG